MQQSIPKGISSSPGGMDAVPLGQKDDALPLVGFGAGDDGFGGAGL